ncbi:MAG: hypothetical protein LBJ92_01605 [Holosporales bacterium]|jgi:hypothetical protein|nr:hypothetical protein [Holosporales bacterium]
MNRFIKYSAVVLFMQVMACDNAISTEYNIQYNKGPEKDLTVLVMSWAKEKTAFYAFPLEQGNAIGIGIRIGRDTGMKKFPKTPLLVEDVCSLLQRLSEDPYWRESDPKELENKVSKIVAESGIYRKVGVWPAYMNMVLEHPGDNPPADQGRIDYAKKCLAAAYGTDRGPLFKMLQEVRMSEDSCGATENCCVFALKLALVIANNRGVSLPQE